VAEHKHQADGVSDIFDSDMYHSLHRKHIIVNSRQMKFTYFGNARDMVLGLSTNRFALLKWQKATAWPLLVVNYNLPPELCCLKEFVLCVGVIPGPNKPYYFDLFLWPFVQEVLKLGCMVTVWDAVSGVVFMLGAFFLAVFGDASEIGSCCPNRHNATHTSGKLEGSGWSCQQTKPEPNQSQQDQTRLKDDQSTR
jgi:hypothetical protein